MSWHVKVRTNTIAILVAAVLALFALGFAGYAIYLSLIGQYPPNIAAMLTALIYVLFAGLVILFTKWFNRKGVAQANQKLPEPADELEAVMQQVVDPAVHQWIRHHPVKAVVATLITGVVVGSNRDMQKAAKSALQRFLGDK